MFDDLGEVEAEHNGNLKITLGGHTVTFHSPSNSDVVTSDQVMQIRHLLKAQDSKLSESDGNFLLVINHEKAKVYQTETKGADALQVKPEDPHGHSRHVHSAHDYSDHIEKPNHNAYFQAIADGLQSAQKILIFGEGGGSSSTMDLFVAWLKEHKPVLAERVVDAVIINETHMTEPEVLAKARAMYLAK